MPYTLTQNELDAVGGMSTAQGGQMSAYNPPIATVTAPAPAPAPAASSAPAPTAAPTVAAPDIASQLNTIKTEALRIQDILNQREASGGLNAPTPTPTPEYQRTSLTEAEEEKIRKQQLKMFRTEINATNKVYDQMLGTAQTQGRDRMGSTVALGARSGVLGSDFGQGQQEKINTYNNQIERGIQAQRASKVAEIMGFARASATAEIAKKNAARKQDAESYLTYLKEAATTKESNLGKLVQAMLEQGVSVDEIDKPELKTLLDQYKTDENTLRFLFTSKQKEQEAAAAESGLKTRKTEAEISKIENDIANSGFFNLSEGQGRYDAQGNLVASRAKTYAPDTGGGLGSFSTGSVREAAQALESTRGNDNFANTGVYLDLYQQAIEGDVLPQDFFKKFPPDLYLNPEDDTVPGYIRQQMQKRSLEQQLGFG